MDPIKNPFSPGAGAPPPELVGRDHVLEQTRILLGRVKKKRPEKSILLTGLRGVGKTVLLNEMERSARKDGYETVSLEAHEDKPLGVLLTPSLRSLLFNLDRMEGAKDKVKRGLAVLRSFVGALKVTISDIEFGLDIEPEKGAADSGDLEVDLSALFVAVAEAAEDRKAAVAILIDEIQYFGEKELSALIMAMHKMQQKQLPLVLLGAGLPILPRLAGESKSYAERLFSFPDIGAPFRRGCEKGLTGPSERCRCQISTSCFRGDISAHARISVLYSRVGIPIVEPRRILFDHSGCSSTCYQRCNYSLGSELFQGSLRSTHINGERIFAGNGGVGLRAPTHWRYR